MRLVTCDIEGERRIGFVLGDQIALADPSEPESSSMKVLIAAGADAMERAFESALRRGEQVRHDVVSYVAPVPDAQKVICLAANFSDFLEETGAEPSPVPVFFAKYPNALTGCDATIGLPGVSDQLGCEAEVAVVVGSVTSNVSVEEAWSSVAGLMPFNDLCLADVQFRTSQWTVGKSLDGFAPCGPALVTLDELRSIAEIPVVLRINGEVIQESILGRLVHAIPETIAYLSSHMTLVPGDVIAMGTPSRVPHMQNPPLFLRSGDVVEVDTGPLGLLSNTIA